MLLKPAYRLMVRLILLYLLILSCYGVQARLEEVRPQDHTERMLYLPSGSLLKPMALGFDNLLADVLWIRAVVYFGGHYMTDKRYPWLYHILDLVTTLDPKFEMPYEFGGIVLAMDEKAVSKSIAILRKGIQHHPNYWRFPFYLGFDYFYLLGDFKTAAGYMELAAQLPGCPPYVPRLAASMKYKTAGPAIALHFLKEIQDHTEDTRIKEEVSRKIKELQQGQLPEAFRLTEDH